MTENLASKITDSELEVMKLLWCAKDALPVTAIREQLQESKGWEPATIKTLISRLVSKGAIGTTSNGMSAIIYRSTFPICKSAYTTSMA